jgi:hypothetical protein
MTQYNDGDERYDWRRDPALRADLEFRRAAVRLYQYLTQELDRSPRRARWIIETAEQVIRDGLAAGLKPRQILLNVRDFILGREPIRIASSLRIGWAIEEPTGR